MNKRERSFMNTLRLTKNSLERENAVLRDANSNMLVLIAKAGYKITTLRIYEKYERCSYNDNIDASGGDDFCYDCDCEGCEHRYFSRSVGNLKVYDFKVADDQLEAVTVLFETYKSASIVKIEDVTNPKRPTVVWEKEATT